MKKEAKTLTVLLVMFFIVVGSAFGVSNSFLSASKGMKYLPDRECDENIDVPLEVHECVAWKHHDREWSEEAYNRCVWHCNNFQNTAAQVACQLLCMSTSYTREWDECIEYETTIIYPCDNSK